MATATEHHIEHRGVLPHPDVGHYDDVNRDVLAMLGRPSLGWWVLFGIAGAELKEVLPAPMRRKAAHGAHHG